MEPKFSAGPWHPGHLGDDSMKCECRGIVNEGYFGGIATVHMDNGISSISEGGNDCPPKEQAVANMHLIAAAPELFAALDQLLDDMGDDGLSVCQAAKDQAKAALAKARGEVI